MAEANRIAEQLQKLNHDARNNVLMNATVRDTAERILNEVQNDNIKLVVNNVWVDSKADNADVKAQQDVRNSGKVWSDDLRVDVDLVDKKTGKVVDSNKSLKIASVPKLTDRSSYIIKGNEYQFTKQARLKPGVYTKRQANEEISSFFNVDKTVDFDRGFNNNFKLTFRPDKKVFMMTYGTKNVPLINALRTIGVTDGEMSSKWGEDVFAANSKEYGNKQEVSQNKLYEAIFGRHPLKTKTDSEIKTEIKERLFSTSLDEETTKITLGSPYKNVNKGALLDASKKIIDINRGDVEEDDREALIFKSFFGPEDHIRERLIKSKDKIISSLKYKLDKTRTINKSISSQSFDPFVVGTITTSQLSNPPSQTNPMSMIGEDNKFTLMGEGGIGSTNAITNDVRNISNSEIGFVDPLHTPEGGAIGIAVHTTKGSVKVGNDLYGQYSDRTGKKHMLKPLDVWDKAVAFPDEYDNSGDKPVAKKSTVRAIRAGKFIEVAPDKVDYILPDAQRMFDMSANSIPFLDSIQGNRGLTASKMQEQALSLKDREKPLFSIKVNGKSGNMASLTGQMVAVPKSPVDGEVVYVTDDEMKIKGKDGSMHKIGLYNNFSLNAESYLTNEPLVKKGDTVSKGQVLADNNYTKDGQMALGANLKVAYMAYKGYNFEDSAIISESAAKKLTSNHMYDFKAKRTSEGVYSKSKFKAYYPEKLKSVQADKLDDDGVIKVGEHVESGDVLIAHLEKKAPTADDIAVGRLDKQLRRDMADNSMTWEKGVKGIVTGVKKHGNSVIVNVKTEEPLKEADKISGLHGNKHIISKVVPDEEMPYDPITGERIDLTMSPIGVSNRINTSQLLENAAGKIAKKTGKQYEIENFADVNNTKKVMEDLAKHGLSDKDMLVDPETGKAFQNPIANGMSHILKLEHVVDHKYSARYKEGYDANEQPVSGGHSGGKNLGRMEMAALLARGADHNLKEMFGIKGQRNDEYWRAMETGAPLPPPKKSFVWDKMLSMMQGAGINVEQKGKEYGLKPMTDADIDLVSRGEIDKPTMTYRKKDLSPIKGGLFDPVKVGGMHGDHFTHFQLPEKTLNPITAHAAATLANMSSTDLEDIMVGKKFVDRTTGSIVKPGTENSISGGPAMEKILGKIDVDNDLKTAEAQVKVTKNETELNKLHRKIRYLRSLKEKGMKPTDYLVSKVLVTPSKFRPMFSMGGSGTVIMSDINDLYQQAAYTAESMGELKKELKTSIKDKDVQDLMMAESRGAIYNDMKAISGLGDPTSYLHRIKDKKGYIRQIDGGKFKQTKEGFYQGKVLQRRQDLVGRSTIILNPDLGGDEIGIPETMASEIFQPFIMKELIGMGYSPLEAKQQIKDESDIFKRARQVVSDKRLVIANRAPTLHRWNMTAFRPKLTKGQSIEVPSVVVTRNFGGDFDGDTFQIHTPISQKAMREAEKMLPSASMIKTGWNSVLNAPSMDASVGAWLVSKGRGGEDKGAKFDSIKDLKDAVRKGNITYADKVTVEGRKAAAGLHVINESVPDDMQKWEGDLTAKNVENWILDVTKKHNGKIALGLADTIKDVGNNYVTNYGFTLGISDTLADEDIRGEVLREADSKARGKSREDSIVDYAEAKEKGEKLLAKKHGDHTMLGVGISSGGGKGISNTAAIALMPGVVMDADDNPIPFPITRSYSEGLDTFGYWAAAHGARGGNIKKSVQSSKPGWFTKDLINSIYDTRIESEDPMDDDGLEYDISNQKNIINRYLAREVKDSGGKVIARRNDKVDSDLINKLNKTSIKSVFIQSPITDPTPGDGFSSWSYGEDHEGKRHNIGDHIGIISSHTITEPSLNLAMKAFHTGGAFQKGGKGKPKGTAFDAMDRIFRFSKNLPDKATLSDVDGTVKSIEKSSVGGWNVTVSNGMKDSVRYVDESRSLKVKVGDKVRPGEELSDGTASPHDILKYKGMRDAQKYLVDKIDEINDFRLDRRDIETVVRGISNTTRIKDPGGFKDYVSGDTAPLTTILNFNKFSTGVEEDVEDTIGDTLSSDYGMYKSGTKVDDSVIKGLQTSGVKRVKVDKDKISHEPFLTPTGIGAKAQSSEDWIARLAHSRIKDVLMEGTTMGWKSTSDEGGNPISKFVAGGFSWQ